MSQEEVLAASARWIPSLITCERSSISLPFDDQQLQIYALSGSLIIPQGTLLSTASSIVGRAFTSKRVVNVADLAESDGQEASALVAAGLHSALVCPILVGGRSLGTVNLGNEAANFFTSHHESLMRSFVDVIASFLGVHELAEAEHKRANTDHLTKLMSRRGILSHLDTVFTATEDNVRPSVLYLDVDGFKVINDTHGHLFGDEALRQIAGRMENVIRTSDQVGRLGGDEFLVVVEDDKLGRTAFDIARRIERAFATPITIGSVSIQATMSIGVASTEKHTSTADDVLHDADQALYAAKRSGQCIAIANKAIRDRSTMIAAIDRDLDNGLASGEITYHYQPIRCLKTRQIMGAEALIRWTHPQLGAIPAPLLVERLEKTGRTEAFTRWSLGTVAEHWSQVQAQFPWFHDKAVSINLSPRQLAWDGYVDLHLAVLERHGFRTRDIIIEVVESAGIKRGDAAEKTLKSLGDHDVVIALDDFGTGHNALAYLTMFPIDAIKLDSSLVSLADKNATARTILKSLASMFTELGLASLGEGIETEVEARVCKQLGIDLGQGWHFGHPTALETFKALVSAEGPPTSGLQGVPLGLAGQRLVASAESV